MLDALEAVQDSFCKVPCKNNDAACWVCEGANVVAMLKPANAFCSDVPFCNVDATTAKCSINAVKQCPGSRTLQLFTTKIEAVHESCGDIPTLLNSATCQDACKAALLDYAAYTEAVMDDDTNAALACLLDAAGGLTDTIPLVSEQLLPTLLPAGDPNPTIVALNTKCTIDPVEVKAGAVIATETLTVTTTEDRDAASAASALLPSLAVGVAAAALAM